jgi:hypothetical protein
MARTVAHPAGRGAGAARRRTDPDLAAQDSGGLPNHRCRLAVGHPRVRELALASDSVSDAP